MLAFLGAWLLGLLLGFRHAFEPDHLSAVATLVTERKSRGAGLWVGALWGVGHTLSLLAVGGALALLQTRLPRRIENGFELCVAVMLVVLGVRSVLRAAREGKSGERREHQHHGHRHLHAGPQGHVHLGAYTFAVRPLLVGLVHGLAGSGAMTALAMAAMPSASARLLYIGLFGAGSVAGMAVLTGVMGLPLQKLHARPAGLATLTAIAGLVAIGLGLFWGAAAAHGIWA